MAKLQNGLIVFELPRFAVEETLSFELAFGKFC